MKTHLISVCCAGLCLTLLSCETPEEEKKRIASKELAELNITALQYGEQLLSAAQNGNIKLIELLLSAGADVNTIDHDGETALMLAVKNQKKAAFTLLLKNGGDVNTVNKNGQSILLTAVQRNDQDAVESLLKSGADVNYADSNRKTALHYAVDEGYDNLIPILISAGADVNAKTDTGYTPLHYASAKGLEDIISDLITARAKVKSKNSNDDTPLHLAAAEGHEHVIPILIKAGAYVNAKNSSGDSPLFLAIRNNHEKSVEVLLQHNADSNHLNLDGISPLYLAEKSSNEKIIELLLRHNARRGNPDDWLAIAVEQDDVNIAKKMLKSGAEPIKNGNGGKLLSLCKSQEMREILKDAGCIETISTDEALRLLLRYEIVNENDAGEVVEYIDWSKDPSEFDANPYATRYDDSFRKYSEKFLYNYKLYKDGQKKLSDFGYVVYIYWLWSKGNCKKHLPKECIMAFITAGSDLNNNYFTTVYNQGTILACTSKERWYALDYAVYHGHTEIVRALIAAGANVNNGFPLHRAVLKERTEIVEILLSVPGIDVNKKDESNRTPLYRATQEGHTKIAELLKAAGARQ